MGLTVTEVFNHNKCLASHKKIATWLQVLLQPCYKVVTTFLQGCTDHGIEIGKIATTLQQGCGKVADHEIETGKMVAARLLQPLLQSCCKVVARLQTMELKLWRDAQPCCKVVQPPYKVVLSVQLNHKAAFSLYKVVTTLLQPCHNLTRMLQPYLFHMGL